MLERKLTVNAVDRLQRAAVRIAKADGQATPGSYCVLGLACRYADRKWARFEDADSFPGPWTAADIIGISRDAAEIVEALNDAGHFDAAWLALRTVFARQED